MPRNSLPLSNIRDDTSRNCVLNLVGKIEKTGSCLDNLKCDFGGKRVATEETDKRVMITVRIPYLFDRASLI